MKTTTMKPDPSPTCLTRRLLATPNIECSLLLLEPGDHAQCVSSRLGQEHVLVMLDGHAAVRVGDMTALLRNEDAVHIPAATENCVTAFEDGWAKLLRIAFVPREVPSEQLFTFPEK